jgi:hypothetical protein
VCGELAAEKKKLSFSCQFVLAYIQLSEFGHKCSIYLIPAYMRIRQMFQMSKTSEHTKFKIICVLVHYIPLCMTFTTVFRRIHIKEMVKHSEQVYIKHSLDSYLQVL